MMSVGVSVMNSAAGVSAAAADEKAELAALEAAMNDCRRSRSFSDMNSNTDFALDVKFEFAAAAGADAGVSPRASPRYGSVYLIPSEQRKGGAHVPDV